MTRCRCNPPLGSLCARCKAEAEPKQAILHAATIEAKHGCSQGLELFRKHYGSEVVVTEDIAAQIAATGKVDMRWLAINVLDREHWAVYHAELVKHVPRFKSKRDPAFLDLQARIMARAFIVQETYHASPEPAAKRR